jgi:hypothetical protein
VFCGSLFAFFSFCCLSFYNLQLLIAPFASSVFHCSLSLPLWYLRGFLSIVVGFTTTYAVSSYHHWCCEFESRSGRSVQHYVIKIYDRSVVFSGYSGCSTNKTDRHDITEILLKVALSTSKQAKNKQTTLDKVVVMSASIKPFSRNRLKSVDFLCVI